jgi:hypothetical protein
MHLNIDMNMRTHIYANTHAYIYTYIHPYTHTYAHACMHAPADEHKIAHKVRHTHIHTQTHICQEHVDLVPPPSGPLSALTTDEAVLEALHMRLRTKGEQKLQRVYLGQRVQALWTDSNGKEEKWEAEILEIRMKKERPGVRVVWVDAEGNVSKKDDPFFIPLLDLHHKLLLPGDEGYEPSTGKPTCRQHAWGATPNM